MIDLYGISRLILREIRAKDCTLSELGSTLELRRVQILDGLHYLENRGYKITKTFCNDRAIRVHLDS